MCQQTRNIVREESCSYFKHVCNVDLMSLEYHAIFKVSNVWSCCCSYCCAMILGIELTSYDFCFEKYWLDNNCTERVEHEKKRLNNETTATGSILCWNIFDLFDNIKWRIQKIWIVVIFVTFQHSMIMLSRDWNCFLLHWYQSLRTILTLE